MAVLVADIFSQPFPTDTLGSRFGVVDRFHPTPHRGVDFKVGAGTPIPVIANGTVVHRMWSDALGNVTVVKHYLLGGGSANDVYSGYCHQSSISVKVGQVVKRGQIIGRSGATGTAAVGAHLHLTMSHSDMGVEYGEVFDPLIYIAAHSRAIVPPAKVVTTIARPGEGLSAIAARSKITLARIEALNPGITPPNYIVHLGQKVRIQ